LGFIFTALYAQTLTKNFLKVVQSTTFKKFIMVRLISDRCNFALLLSPAFGHVKCKIIIKIGFLKAHRRWAFKKPIFIMRITALLSSKTQFISEPDILGQKQSLLLARIQYSCDRYLHFFLPYVYF
jgi:hypothetical protein